MFCKQTNEQDKYSNIVSLFHFTQHTTQVLRNNDSCFMFRLRSAVT